MRTTLASAAAVALAALAGGLTAGDASAHWCAKSGELRFRAADGTRLAGHRFGRGATAVLLAHESRSNACRWAPYARRLAGLGYLAIAFDFRGNGESQRRTGAAASRLPADVTAAAKLARRLGARKVVFVGGSMGGTAVVVAAANARPPVDAVVSLSGVRAHGGMNALAAAPKLTMPVLYVVGRLDQGYPEESQALYDATGSQSKRLEVRELGTHGGVLMGDPDTRALVEGFIAESTR